MKNHTVLAKNICITILIAVIFIMINCTQYVNYTPDPTKDVDRWIANFANQRSFAYHYTMKTLTVYTEARGECLIGVGEHVTGLWRGNEQELDFEYYGLFDLEYEKQGNTWIEAARGEQTEILVQIERVLEFDKFEYLPEYENYAYRFKANAAFLSPLHRKEMIGEIIFSAKDYRPVSIWAGLPDSSVYWTIKLSEYNRLQSIKPPVLKWNRYVLDLGTDYKAVKRRLDLIGIPFRIKREGQKVEVMIPGYVSNDEVRRYFDRTEISVSDIVEDRAGAKRVLELDNKKRTIYVGEGLFSGTEIKNCRVKFDAIGRPFIVVILNKPHDIPGKVLVEVNDEPPEIINIDNPGKLSKIKLYFNKTFNDMRILRAQLLQPLYDIDIEF